MRLPFQFLLLAVLLALVPLLGYQYIEDLSGRLLQSRQQGVGIVASSVARALEEFPAVFSGLPIPDRVEPGRDLYAGELPFEPVLDGKDDEWGDLLKLSPVYGRDHIIEILRAWDEDSLEFRLATGYFDDAIYIFARVSDDRVVYREVNSISVHRNDNLQIVTVGTDRIARRYTIATVQPGEATAFLVAPRDQGARALGTEQAIRAYWLATETGYNVEARIPRNLIGSVAGFAVSDIDNQETRALIATLGTTNVFDTDSLGSLLVPSPAIGQRLSQVGDPASGIRILDKHGRVIAQSGDLLHFNGTAPDRTAVDMILPSPIPTIVSERRPMHIDDRLFTVVAEQATTDIAAWHRHATGQLFAVSALLLFAGCLVLYVIGWVTSRRITRLRRQVDNAVDTRGRIRNELSRVSRSDEIGTLSNNFAEVIERLRQYNTYLEDMSSRLAHELRTPVTVVRSSLDNLSMEELQGDARVYLERANDGAARLATILSSMTEATRLEQSLDGAELEIFDLTEVLKGCVQGYQLAWPERQFLLSIEAESVKINGVPDSIAQMLDKLVGNAVDFSPPDKPVRIRLTVEDDAVLRVINDGSSLPADMSERLFDSMVSVRQAEKGEASHLGLGLYIARVVAEFHGGTITAADREDAKGVMISVRLPILRLTGRRN